MRRAFWIALVGLGSIFLPGCGSGSSDEGTMKGAPPPVVQPDPGMKAPEDRPGMKKDGGAAGAG